MAANNSYSATPERIPESSGATSPWLNILWHCLAWVWGAAVLAAVVLFFIAGWPAVTNVVMATLLVTAFSGISLAVAHFVGRKNPSAVMGAFLAAYFVKVVGFGALIFALPRPDWVLPQVFMWTAVAAVILWQIAEMFTFARTRWLLYGDA